MAEARDHGTVAGDEATTRDVEIHGESSHYGKRETIDGTVCTQRGRPGEIPRDVLEHGHEPTDVQVRGIVYTVIGLIVFIVLSATFVAGVLYYLRATDKPPVVMETEKIQLVPPQPRLQVAPQSDRAAIEGAAKARLNGYGWSDGDPQLARIPIVRAMELMAAHGWPDPELSGVASPRAGPGNGGEVPGGQARVLSRIPLEQQPPAAPPFEAPP